MIRRIAVLNFLLWTLFLLAACQSATGSDECNDGGTLLTDDFSGEQNCGWTLYSQGGATVNIDEGVLNLSTSQPGQVWWTNPGRKFDDAIITVQARQLSGPNDNAYGVICRYQDEKNFYIFLVSGDGYYAIGKFQSGQSQIIYLSGDGQYQPSDVINQGVATNQLRVGCVGNELSLMVNGLPLVTVTDPTFVIGDVGVAASTFQPGTAGIAFDNFQVIAP